MDNLLAQAGDPAASHGGGLAAAAGDPARRLRAAGLRVTAPRLATLRALAAHPHADAEVVAGEVRRSLGAVSTQSVYNVLAAFVEHGLARRIEPAGSTARYELRVGDNHHHAICRRCGSISDVDCAAGAAPCLAPVPQPQTSGFVIDEAEVTYWGLCPECAAQPTDPVAG